MRSRSGPGGISVVEALVALLLGGLLVHAASTVLAAHRRVVRGLLQGVEASETGRIATGVLRRELRRGVPGADWTAPGGDSLVARGFRGTGIVCAVEPDGTGVTVVRRGRPTPRAGRDSALVLASSGTWSRHLLVHRESGDDACPDATGGSAERWRLKPALPSRPVLVRLFRSGSYHLVGGTLRYRRGRAGRQPLTPETLDDAGSALEPAASGGVRLRLRFGELSVVPGRNPRSVTLWPPDG